LAWRMPLTALEKAAQEVIRTRVEVLCQ
jgi:hypothetical protein